MILGDSKNSATESQNNSFCKISLTHMILENKVTIVTGASRGVGASIAQVLAAEGAAVCVNYLKSADQANQV
ncbi:MAG: SDR family NAD(P)-dependent oxidoreductase, partial [Cyanobacteria bacterium P01_F01_bin.116]